LTAIARGWPTRPARRGWGSRLLKFFELEARFPRNASELPPAAVSHIAEQVDVDPAQLARYDWSGRTIKYHRAQIRDALGFREVTRADEHRLIDWLAEICPGVLGEDRQRDALLSLCPQRASGAARPIGADPRRRTSRGRRAVLPPDGRPAL
jgi:Domain of unknown function (DUF4158)